METTTTFEQLWPIQSAVQDEAHTTYRFPVKTCMVLGNKKLEN